MPSSSWLNLANRVAIVTGAGSGIGRAVAQELERHGCRLLLLDINKQHQDVESSSILAGRFVACNVADRQQVEQVLQQSTEGEEASILVNCAGITRDAFVGNLTEQDWDQVINVNLKGTFNMCQSFLKHSTAPEGSIINVGSVVSEQGNLGQVNYASSKGGVLGLTRALAKETARRGVRVNAVVPGFIATPMAEAVPEHVLNNILQNKIALRRLGKPEDVANLVAFLASERSQYITGEAIECSGMISL